MPARKLIKELLEYDDAVSILCRHLWYELDIPLFLVNKEGKVAVANPAAHAMLGFMDGELIGKHFAEFTKSDDIEADVNSFNKLISGEIHKYSGIKTWVSKNHTPIPGKLYVRKCTIPGYEDIIVAQSAAIPMDPVVDNNVDYEKLKMVVETTIQGLLKDYNIDKPITEQEMADVENKIIGRLIRNLFRRKETWFAIGAVTLGSNFSKLVALLSQGSP